MEAKLTPIENDYPLDRTLCVFRPKEDNNRFFIGYMDWSIQDFPIRDYGKITGKICFSYSVDQIESYQYILNETGGYLFIKS